MISILFYLRVYCSLIHFVELVFTELYSINLRSEFIFSIQFTIIREQTVTLMTKSSDESQIETLLFENPLSRPTDLSR